MDPDLPPPPPPEHVIPVDVDQLIDTCTKLAAAFRHVAELFARASSWRACASDSRKALLAP